MHVNIYRQKTHTYKTVLMALVLSKILLKYKLCVLSNMFSNELDNIYYISTDKLLYKISNTYSQNV